MCRAVLLNARQYGISRHLLYGFGYYLALENLAPLLVYDLPLLVHYGVVLQYVLSDIKVVRLDILLCCLHPLAEHLHIENYVLAVCAESVNNLLDLSETLHYGVFHRYKEAAFTGVSLTSRTASELVVYTPRLVALRAYYIESACGYHLRFLTVGLRLCLGIILLIELGSLYASARVL